MKFILFLIYVELMILVAEITFWIAISIVFYTYVGYPILLSILSKSNSYTFFTEEELPSLTLIVTAYNEGDILSEKVDNCLKLFYPTGKFNITFITDGSDDDSNDIIKSYPSVKLLYEPLRKGKLAAMNRAMSHTESEIVVFSDANTLLNEDALIKIARHYADAKVGGVAGEKKIYKEKGVADGEGAYWMYESYLKQKDSDFYSVVGAAGELFSIRRSLYTVINQDVIIEDFVQSLLVCKNGHIIRYEPAAHATERASISLADEKERKIRISAGGFQAIGLLTDLLNIFHYGRLSFLYISHRVLRWTLCPLSLLLVLFSSLYVYINTLDNFYGAVFFLQVLFYLLAIAGYFMRRGPLYVIFYFCFMNYCVFAGLLRFIYGKQQVTWQRAQRSGKI